jgi:hypothetical protein
MSIPPIPLLAISEDETVPSTICWPLTATTAYEVPPSAMNRAVVATTFP